MEKLKVVVVSEATVTNHMAAAEKTTMLSVAPESVHSTTAAWETDVKFSTA